KGGDKMREREKPVGWPENVPFPTEEEVRKAVEKGKELIIKMTEELEGKISGPTSEMLQTLIDI
ncbi:MAG: hypothetical protein DRG25_04185, partial [Deltaproteobacteria bacterium]